MRAKIIKNNEDFNREFKVRRMNYDEVIINYPSDTGIKNYEYDEVELISDGDVDEFLIDNKDFLQVKLNRGISVFFYEALKNSIQEEINEKLTDFNLLKDKYIVNKKGIWDKEIICVVNHKMPLLIRSSGVNFQREGYNILVTRIEKNSFFGSVKEDINKLRREIDRKELMLARYGKAIVDMRFEKKEELMKLM